MKSIPPRLPVLKQLSCPQCGRPVNQVLATTQTIVCPACQTHIAVGGEELAILGKGVAMPAPPAPIYLGSTATFENTEFFVMGRVVYLGWDPSEDDDRWWWTEWLLGGSDGRLLWLSHDDEDGFVLYRKIRLREAFDVRSSSVIPLDENRRVPVAERYPARIVAAEGELTWQAKRGDELTMLEGQLDQKKYSVQCTPQELEMYEGTPLLETAVAQAFGNPKWAQQIQSRAGMRSMLYTVAVIALMFVMAACALTGIAYMSGKSVTKQTVALSRQSPSATIQVNLNSAGRPVLIKTKMLNSIPADGYAELDIDVTTPDDDDLSVVSQEFWHETGYDEGYWDESDYSGSGSFVPEQRGQHILEVQMGQATVSTMQVEVEVLENYFLPGWFVGYAGVFATFAGGLFFWASKKK